MLLFFAVTGVLFGCTGDKYDNLRIEATLISGEVSQDVLQPVFEGDVLTLELNSSVVMRFDVSGVGGINGALRFVCDDADALEITDKQYSSNGTTATIKALKPTYGNNYFTLKALSVETNKNPKEIKVKIVSPIAEINFNKAGGERVNLVATKSVTSENGVVDGSVNLNAYMKLVSKYPPFATTQTEVDFSVDALNPIASAIVINNGILSVSENSDVEGVINITAKSRSNSAVFVVVPVTIVKNVNIDSVGLAGKSNGTSASTNTQIAFNNPNIIIQDKTSIDLFSNSENYHKEEFSFKVNTPVSVDISAVFKSGADIVEVTKGSYFETVDGVGNVTSAVQNFVIDANKVKSGVAVLGFEIALKGYDNKISYKLGDDADITVRVSAVARGISLKQGSAVVDSVNDRLVVYDVYGDSENSLEGLGTKLTFGVSTGTTVEIDSQNRALFITIKDIADNFVVMDNGFDAFILSKEDGTSITPQEYNGQWGFVINSNEPVFALFNSTNSNGLLTGNYKFLVSTIVEYFALDFADNAVDFYNNTTGALGADGIADRLAEVRQLEYLIRAARGVADIQLSYGLDTSDPTNAAIENDLNTSGIVLKYLGDTTQIMLKVVPADADLEAIRGIIDSTFVEVSQLSPFQFGLTGLKRGTGQFVIDAGNGRQIVKTLRVVDELAGENIIVRSDSAYSNVSLSEVEYQGDGSLSKVIAKAGGMFNIFVTTKTASVNGIISNEYSVVGNPLSALITSSGVVSARSETDSSGVTIEVVTTYYQFKNIGGNFVPQLCVKTNSFNLVIFVALKDVRLNAEVVEVYDSNSLGFGDQDKSMFSVYPVVTPNNATINNSSGHITYNVINPDGATGFGVYLVNNGSGNFQAIKPTPAGQFVRLIITINEFGIETKLVCRVTIKTAAQISSIDLENINYIKYDLQYQAMRIGQQIDVKYTTSPRDVFNNNLKFVLYNYDETTHSTTLYDPSSGLVDMQNSGLVGLDGNLAQSVTNDNINVRSLVGRGDFRIAANSSTKAGFLVLRIFAVDSMTGLLSGKLYTDLLIEITNGTIIYPFPIYDADDLSQIREAPTLHYVLMNDISLYNISSWQPIANFSGTLNGFNLVEDISGGQQKASGVFFEIKGLRLSVAESDLGLFANSSGGLLNLRLTGVIINAEGQSANNIAALVAQNNGLILNCSVEFNGYSVRSLTGTGEVNIGTLAADNMGNIVNFANPLDAAGGQGDSSNTTRNIADYLVDVADYEDATQYSFDNILNMTSSISGQGAISNLNEAKLNRIKNDTVLNPISGNINVSDGARAVHVGGIAGVNSGNIYGVYTLYRAMDELFAASGAVQFVTVYQSQGVDALININSNNTFAITNPNSAVGGIVGKNEVVDTAGTICNVSVGGMIKALDNVGGVFGISSGTGTQVLNVLSFVTITARNYVGGVGGFADDGTNLKFLRADNYEQRGLGINSAKLITASDMGITFAGEVYIGGVIGYLADSILSYGYAAEFVNDADFISIKAENYGSEMFVGGVVGSVENSIIEKTFAKLFISAYGSIGGVAGSSDSSFYDVYFIGNITNLDGAPVSGAILGTALNDLSIISYRASWDGTDYTASVLGACGSAGAYSISDISPDYNSAYWSSDVLDMGFNEGYPVFKVDYFYDAKYPLFVQKVPSAIDVEVNDDDEVGYGNKFYKDDSGALILKYSAANSKNSFGFVNILNPSELFKVTTTPSNLGAVQVVVESSNRSILDIDDSGKIYVYGTGSVTLTFYAKLNVSASATIEVKVIPYVSSISLYTSNNLNNPGSNYLYDDMLAASAGKSISIRKSTDANVNYLQLYPVFYDGDTIISNADYGIVYNMESDDSLIGGSTNPVAIDKNNKLSITSANLYAITLNAQITQIGGEALSDPLQLLDTKYFTVLGFEGATSIELSRTALEIAPLALYVGEGSVVVELTSDVMAGEGYNVVVYEIVNGVKEVLEVNNIEKSPFDIEDETIFFNYHEDYSLGEGLYRKSYAINLAEEYVKGQLLITEDRTFIFEFIALSNLSVSTELEVKLVHQDIINATAEHHLFKQMENASLGNSLFTFNTSSSDEIISGEFGLLMVNTYPQSASIEKITIESSVVDGNYIGFSQLIAVNEYNPTGMNSYAYMPSKGAVGSVASGRVGIELFRNSYLKDHLGNDYTPNYIANAAKAFDGRLYVQTITSSALNNGMEFDIYINVYIHGETEPRVYVHHIVVRNIALVDLVAAGAGVISEGGSDSVDINIITAGQVSHTDVSIVGVAVEGLNLIEEDANLNFNKFIIGDNGYWVLRNLVVYKSGSQIVLAHLPNGDFYSYGDDRYDALKLDDPLKIVNRGVKITITVSAVVMESGQEYSREKSISLNVVDVVIVKQSGGQYVSIEGIDLNGALTLSVDSSLQLRAVFEERIDDSVTKNIFGSSTAIDKFTLAVSRNMDNGATSSWFAKRNDSSGNYVTLNDSQIMQTLPFDVNIRYTTQDNSMAAISLVGSSVGSNALRLQFSYGYIDGALVLLVVDSASGQYKVVDAGGEFDGVIVEYDNINGKYKVGEDKFVTDIQQISRDFVVNVIISTSEDEPEPIFNEQDLKGMQAGGDYILMNDIVIESHTPISTAISTLDGNNKIITIKNFNLTNIPASDVQLGLFGTVQQGTVLKNLIIALPNDKREAMILDDRDDIKIGGIAGVNKGIINNCDVITVSNTEKYFSSGEENPQFYSGTDYSLNVHTSVQIGGSWTRALLGGLVGLNDTTGVITNSRVGREEVGIVKVTDSIGTEYSMTRLDSVVPATVIKLEGTGVVGGFVGRNDGVVSSSYFKNGQIVNISYSSISYGTEETRIASAGFAGVNNGAIYGSFAAGFEEENFIDGSGRFMFDNSGAGVGNLRDEFNEDRKLGGGIFSNGNVAGFVYQNTGHIQDSYSNINLSGDTTFALIRFDILQSAQLVEYGNIIAGGFVYINGTPTAGLQGAYITTSYSLSNLKHNITTHGAFTGVSGIGDVQNYGTIEKCYYLNGVQDNYYDDNEPADKVNKQEDVEIDEANAEEVENIGTNEFILPDSFAGFSFDVEEYSTNNSSVAGGGINLSGVWSMYKIGESDNGYPELVSANYIATSVRIERNNSSGGNYNYLYVQGFETGSENNPYLIYNAKQYNRLFDIIYQTSPTIQDEVMAKFVGNVRLAGEIDFAEIDAQPSSRLFEYVSRLQGRSVFDGNNMPIKNVTINSTSTGTSNVSPSVGLFGALNGVGVKNLTISIDRVTASNSRTVGGLAGIIVDSYVSNINLVAATQTQTGESSDPVGITGYNFAGALAGIVVSSNSVGGYYIKNISSNVAVNASRITASRDSVIKTGNIWEIIRPQMVNGVASSNLNLKDLPDVSYAGGIAGVIDLKQYIDEETRNQQEDNDISLSLNEVNAKALRVGDVNIGFGATNFLPNQAAIIVGEYVGGVAGFVGEETYLQDGFFQIKNDNRIRAATAGGGIAGINYGLLDQVYVSPNKEGVKALDANTKALTEVGTSNSFNKELFYHTNGSGLNLRLGGIVGINIVGETFLGSGSITDSLSRADVRNQSALSVGGIAGATYGGKFSNVYTTGGLLANVNLREATIGGIVGEILQADNNNPYIVSITTEKREVQFSAAVAMNFFLVEDFAALKTFTQNAAAIDADYGYVDYDSGVAVNISLSEIQNKSENTIYDLYDTKGYRDSLSQGTMGRSLARVGALFGLSTHYQNDIDVCVSDGEFNFSSMYIYNKYKDNVATNRIRLFIGIDASHGGSQTGTGTNKKNVSIITADDVRNLFNIDGSGIEPSEKEEIFPRGTWSERIWKYDTEFALPYLKYGYMPAVEYIYTAEDFQRAFKSPSAKKIYYIMADLDFSELNDTRYIIDANFRGQIIGVTQYINKDNKTLGRNPILFNLVLRNTPVANHALFQRATNAVFKNIDFVVREYQDNFPVTRGGNIPPLATTGAMVVAIATNTTFSNINVYDNLALTQTLGYLHTYSMESGSRVEHYYVVDSNDPTFNDDVNDEKYGENKYREVNIKTSIDSDGNVHGNAMVNVDSDGNISSYAGTWKGSETRVGYTLATYSRNQNGDIDGFSDKGILKTGAKSFGVLIANGFNITLNGCSASFREIRVQIVSNQVEADQAVIIGGLAGNVSGTIKPFVRESNGVVTETLETSFYGDIIFRAYSREGNLAEGAIKLGNLKDIREVDIGGVFGKFNGRASGLNYQSYSKGIEVGHKKVDVNDEEDCILYRNKGNGTENSSNEIYIAVGGLIGSTEIPKNSLISDFNVSDSSVDMTNGGSIKAYVNFISVGDNGKRVQGNLSVGGIIGINGVHLSGTSFVQKDEGQSVEANIRSAEFEWNGNTADLRNTTNIVYIGGAVGRSLGRIEGVSTSAKIEVKDLNENSGARRDNRVYAGGIVGAADNITINNVIAHGSEIVVNCGGEESTSLVYVGGILGNTMSSNAQISIYNAVSAYDINVATEYEAKPYQRQRNVVVGGIIGRAVILQMANAVSLGDIYVGTVHEYPAYEDNGVNQANAGKMSDVSIGGLIGVITQKYYVYGEKSNIAALQESKDKGSVSASKITYAGILTAQAQATTITSEGKKYELAWTRFSVGGAVGRINDLSTAAGKKLETTLLSMTCDLYFSEEVMGIYSNDYGNAVVDVKYSGKASAAKAAQIDTKFGIGNVWGVEDSLSALSSIPQYALGFMISNIMLDIDTANVDGMPYATSVLRDMLGSIFAGNTEGGTPDNYTKLIQMFSGVHKSEGASYSDFNGVQAGEYYSNVNFPALLMFEEGSRFRPIKIVNNDYEDQLRDMESGKYYILGSNITATSTIGAFDNGGWVLNANTWTIEVAAASERNTLAVFSEIPAGAAVVGLLLENVNISDNAAIATINNGTLFKCGVTGEIRGDNTAGLVFENHGRIISSFSRVEMLSSTISASGIATINSGEIISSFSTSTMNANDASVQFAGIALNNTGTISNCYTDANMINEDDSSGANTYAIAKWQDGKIFNSTYDRNAFVGNILERKPEVEGTSYALITGVVSSYMKDNEWVRNSYEDGGYITSTPQLTANFLDIGKTLIGGWTSPDYAAKTYLYTERATGGYKSTSIPGNTEDHIYVDDSWFNSGYGMVDMFRIMYSESAKVRLLQMMYTGNGNEPKADTEDDPWNGGIIRETNHFVDMPYQITNIGVLELFISRDTKDGVSKKSWYILKNNISALAYDEWSLALNGEVDIFGNVTTGSSSNPSAFYGDFNGNNKTILNLNSKYGLFRIVAAANTTEFSRTKFYSNNPVVYDLTIKDSVSQTGMVAAYLGKGAEIINVKLEDCSVVNGNSENNYSGLTQFYGPKINGGLASEPQLGNGLQAVSIGYSAGAFVAYMTGGSIIDCEITTDMIVRARDYAGGIVGRIVVREDDYAPIISLKEGTISSTGNVEVIAHTAGGIAGQANKFAIGKDADNIGETVKAVKAYLVESRKNNENENTFKGAGWYDSVLRYQNGDKIVSVGSLMNGFVLNSNITVAGFADVGKEEMGAVLSKGLGLNTITQGGLIGEVSYDDIGKTNLNTLINIKGKSAEPNSPSENSVVNVTFGTEINSISTKAAYSGGVIGNSLAPSQLLPEGVPSRLIIKNVTNNSTSIQTGVIVRQINGIPSNFVVSDVYYGGIVGHMESGNLMDVSNNGSLTAYTGEYAYVGGIVGLMNDGYIGISNSNFRTVGGAAAELSGMNATHFGTGYVGGVVGSIQRGIIGGQGEEVMLTNKSQVKKANYGGGIVGYATVELGPTQIIYAKNEGTFEGEVVGLGGIIGGISQSVTIDHLINLGDITSILTSGASFYYAGGIVGYVDVGIAYEITNCINNGNVEHKATTNAYVGGIAGYIKGAHTSTGGDDTIRITVEDSSNSKAIMGYVAGGIIGSGDGVIELTGTNSGDIGNGNTAVAGGIIGQFTNGKLNIHDANNSGSDIKGSADAGGIIGKISGSSVTISLANLKINEGASIGSSDGNAGGLIGSVGSTAVEVNIDKGVRNGGIVTGNQTAGGFIGLLQQNMVIEDLINEGEIQVGNDGDAGGIVGHASGKNLGNNTFSIIIKNPINKGNISGGNSGGIAGYIENVQIEITSGEVNNKVGNSVEIMGKESSGGIVGKLGSGQISGGGSGGIAVYGEIGSTGPNGSASSGGIVGKIVPIISQEIIVIVVENFIFRGQEIQANAYAGGVVGWVDANSKPNASITITGKNLTGVVVESDQIAGGIVGYAQGSSRQSVNVGNSSQSTINQGEVNGLTAGGIVGHGNYVNIAGVNKGDVNGSTNAGGILGTPGGNNVKIMGGESSGKIDGGNAGGVVGNTQSATSSSEYAIFVGSVDVSGEITGANVGGFIGRDGKSGHSFDGSVKVSATIGDKDSQNVGGAIGWAKQVNDTLFNHVEIRTVTLAGNGNIGGYIGNLNSGGANGSGILGGKIKFAGEDAVIDNHTKGNIGGYIGNVEGSSGVEIKNMQKFQIEAFITEAADSAFGGIVGNLKNGGKISNSISVGSGSGGGNIGDSFNLHIEDKGGIVGRFGGSITIASCTNNISIYSKVGAVGGFVAKTNFQVTFSGTNINAGNITRTADGDEPFKMAGGFVGDATSVSMTSGTHTNTGQVSASAQGDGISALAGGFAGRYGSSDLIGFRNESMTIFATKDAHPDSGLTKRYIALDDLLAYGYAAAGGIIGEKTSSASVARSSSKTEANKGPAAIRDTTVTDTGIMPLAWKTDGNKVGYNERIERKTIPMIGIPPIKNVIPVIYIESNAYVTGYMGIKIGKCEQLSSGMTTTKRLNGGWRYGELGAISWKRTIGGDLWEGTPFLGGRDADLDLAVADFIKNLPIDTYSIPHLQGWEEFFGKINAPGNENTKWDRGGTPISRYSQLVDILY